MVRGIFFHASHSARPSSVFNSSRSIPVKNNRRTETEEKRTEKEARNWWSAVFQIENI